jgi:PTS system fructose-specific IIC component/PTS system nitrogen regulatory IIA component
MVLVPEKDTEKHLRILKRLAGLLENPQFYIDLQAQKDPQGAWSVIRKYEDMFIALN